MGMGTTDLYRVVNPSSPIRELQLIIHASQLLQGVLKIQLNACSFHLHVHRGLLPTSRRANGTVRQEIGRTGTSSSNKLSEKPTLDSMNLTIQITI